MRNIMKQTWGQIIQNGRIWQTWVLMRVAFVLRQWPFWIFCGFMSVPFLFLPWMIRYPEWWSPWMIFPEWWSPWMIRYFSFIFVHNYISFIYGLFVFNLLFSMYNYVTRHRTKMNEIQDESLKKRCSRFLPALTMPVKAFVFCYS